MAASFPDLNGTMDSRRPFLAAVKLPAFVLVFTAVITGVPLVAALAIYTLAT